eukprot:scaffold17406_cov116-Isochrysis_galbana.AAC.7
MSPRKPPVARTVVSVLRCGSSTNQVESRGSRVATSCVGDKEEGSGGGGQAERRSQFQKLALIAREDVET